MSKISDRDFFAACLKSKSIAEMETATGMKKEAIQARRTEMRLNNWPIPDFVKGAPTKASKNEPTEEDYAFMAEARGLTIEQVKEEATQIKLRVAARGEKVKAGRQASKAQQAQVSLTPATAPAVLSGQVTIGEGISEGTESEKANS